MAGAGGEGGWSGVQRDGKSVSAAAVKDHGV